VSLAVIAAYGAGVQIQVEDRAAHLAGVSAFIRDGGMSSFRPIKPWRPSSSNYH
jgi:hypothetical protein